MAKKKQEKKVVENVDIDALVDEGKNIDTVKVSEVLADKEEDNKEAETVEIEDLIQEAKDAQADEIIKDVMKETDEVGAEEGNDEDCAEEGNDEDCTEEGNDEDCTEEAPYIVIPECTGEVEEKAPQKEKTVKEPWYVSRAKRIGDYYNW